MIVESEYDMDLIKVTTVGDDNFLDEAGYKKECLVFKDDIAINEIWKKKN